MPTVIKEHKNMKKQILFITIIPVAFFLSWGHAFLAEKDFYKSHQAPVSPMSGRGSEKQFYKMLTKPSTSYTTWLKKGKNYIARKEYEQAILAFRKAVNLRPAEEDARFLLGWCYEKRGKEGLPGDQTNWDKLAEMEYEKAIGLADHLPARFNLAMLLRRQERFNSARVQLEHILLIDHKSALGKKAQNALADLFDQDMRPRHISVDFPEYQK